MKNHLISKLLFTFAALVMIATALLIPLSGTLMHAKKAHAASTLPTGILPSPSATPPSPTPTVEPAKWTISQHHIPYVTIAGVKYIFNLYRPSPAPSAPTPLVLVWHGCCHEPVNNPDLVLQLSYVPTSPVTYLFHALINNGYQVVTLGYPINDVAATTATGIAAKAAVRFFRAHASTYNIDPKRIIAWGYSMGGDPANLEGIATASEAPQFEVGQNLQFSDRVEAVLDWYGVTDIIKPAWINSSDAPTLIQHGALDNVVKPSISATLEKELTTAGVFVELQWVANARHQFRLANTSPINPDFTDIAKTAITFLNAKVRDNPNPLPQ
jgi:acetyl esterase/lipase